MYKRKVGLFNLPNILPVAIFGRKDIFGDISLGYPLVKKVISIIQIEFIYITIYIIMK